MTKTAKLLRKLADRRGFEPLTSAFGGQCHALCSRFFPRLFRFSAYFGAAQTPEPGAKRGPNLIGGDA